MEKTVVVVGGGITGIGIARDLAMRGLEVKVLERGEVGCETSTHFHGMLHSGARYAVKDPYAAEKCMQENRVLRKIAESYLDTTEGLFLKLEQDSEEYFQEKIRSCRECGIPVEKLSEEALRNEIDVLSDKVEKGFQVPDGVIRPEELLAANIKSARNHGAKIIENAEVVEFVESNSGDLKGVTYRKDGDERLLKADFFVNSTGPWAEKTAELADAEADMSPTRGVMTVVENQSIDYVLNRCRETSDGDIIVPKAGTAVIGTTSEEVEDPDDFEKPEREEALMLEQADEIVEDISDEGLLGSYWGLRPLYNPSRNEGRDVTREFHMIDHSERDEVGKFLTVVGGKWTTYRYMAEKTSDRVCEELGVEEKCRTDELELPEVSEKEVKDRDWPPVQ
jgi:glycerol-3-phosphate dehydrogenase